jgi:hypothetical protein
MVGHKAAAEIMSLPLQVEEKVDGSQLSIGRFDGFLRVRSSGAEFPWDAPEHMFAPGVEALSKLDLHDGWTYRGEYVRKPKHNVLTYGRVPKNLFIVFDINTGEEDYLDYEAKKVEADRLGLDCVPLLYQGIVTADILRELLQRESILGGTTVEGVVLKQYEVFGRNKKVLMAKYVAESFKEKHIEEWGASNPSGKDTIELIATQLRTGARWLKSVQHLREEGKIEGSPRDIGKLINYIVEDVEEEEEDWIKDQLFKWAWPKIKRYITRGVPEWYKELIMEEQFEEIATSNNTE